jgi:hypothetical protein
MKQLLRILQACLISVLILCTSCNKDECENTVCINGGVCVNGDCDCPDGYEGPSCADQETPIRMRIHSITVTKFPAYDNGSNWDIGDGPDIFFQVFDGNTLIDESAIYFEDADPSQDYLFSDLNIGITDVLGNHAIQLLDYDDGITADDWMGGIEFVPYWSNTNGFPTIIELDAGGGVAFRVGVSYVW